MASIIKIACVCLLGLLMACSNSDKPTDNQNGLTLDQEDSAKLEPERSVIKTDTSASTDDKMAIEAEIQRTKERIAVVEKILENTKLPAAEKDAYIREIETLKLRLPELEEKKKKVIQQQKEAQQDRN